MTPRYTRLWPIAAVFAAWLVLVVLAILWPVHTAGHLTPPPARTEFQPLVMPEPSSSRLAVEAPAPLKEATIERAQLPGRGTPGIRTAYSVPVIAWSGLASTYGPGYSEWWVALPIGPGHHFRVCGPVACLTLLSTDKGPTVPGRIVDLPVHAFERLCACSWRLGLIPVSVELVP